MYGTYFEAIDMALALTPWVPNDGDLRLCIRNGSVPNDGDLRHHDEFQISRQLSLSQHTQRESTIYKSNIGQPAFILDDGGLFIDCFPSTN
jgi:hypothetical protein